MSLTQRPRRYTHPGICKMDAHQRAAAFSLPGDAALTPEQETALREENAWACEEPDIERRIMALEQQFS